MTEENNNGKYKLSTEHRITTVENNYDNLEKSHKDLRNAFVDFKDNHFQHFKNWVYGLLISTLIGIIFLFLK